MMVDSQMLAVSGLWPCLARGSSVIVCCSAQVLRTVDRLFFITFI